MTTTAMTVADLGQQVSDAVAARDTDVLRQLSHPNLVLDVVPDRPHEGLEASAAFMDTMFQATPDMTWIIDRMLPIDDQRTAVALWTYTGTFTGGPFLGLQPTGRKLEARGVSVMEFDEDGLQIRNTIYWDNLSFARHAGMLPPAGSVGDKAVTATFNAITRLRKSITHTAQRAKEWSASRK